MITETIMRRLKFGETGNRCPAERRVYGRNHRVIAYTPDETDAAWKAVRVKEFIQARKARRDALADLEAERDLRRMYSR